MGQNCKYENSASGQNYMLKLKLSKFEASLIQKMHEFRYLIANSFSVADMIFFSFLLELKVTTDVYVILLHW